MGYRVPIPSSLGKTKNLKTRFQKWYITEDLLNLSSACFNEGEVIWFKDYLLKMKVLTYKNCFSQAQGLCNKRGGIIDPHSNSGKNSAFIISANNPHTSFSCLSNESSIKVNLYKVNLGGLHRLEEFIWGLIETSWSLEETNCKNSIQYWVLAVISTAIRLGFEELKMQ